MSKASENNPKELRESNWSFINWVARSEWIAKGKPYEEHEEVLTFLNQEKRENGLLLDLH
ncbi:8723_t:CDS:1, partial [Ambispora gerdemannii]